MPYCILQFPFNQTNLLYRQVFEARAISTPHVQKTIKCIKHFAKTLKLVELS